MVWLNLDKAPMERALSGGIGYSAEKSPKGDISIGPFSKADLFSSELDLPIEAIDALWGKIHED